MDEKQTILHKAHIELGAKFTEFAGYSMPVQYRQGIMKEHLHTRDAAGLFDVSHMGQLKVTSKENDFSQLINSLETLMPADLCGLEVNRQCYSFLMNESGGLLDDLMIANRGDHFLLIVNAAKKEDDFKHLDSKIGRHCDIEWLSDRALIAIQGPLAEKVVSRFSDQFHSMRFLDCMNINILGTICWVSRSGYTGEDGFELSIPNNVAEKIVLEILKDERVRPIGLGARDSLRLEAGLCLYGHDLNEKTTPIEASLGWAIHKARRKGGKRAGGFPGETKIFNQLESGTVKKRIGLEPVGRALVREGSQVFSDLECQTIIGHVSSGGFSPVLQRPVSVAFVNSDWAKIGTEVFVNLRGKVISAFITKLPFVENRYRYRERKSNEIH